MSQLSIDVSAGGTFAVTQSQVNANYMFKLTGTPGAGVNVTFPQPLTDANAYSRVVNNTTAEPATISCAVGASYTLLAGLSVILDFDPVLGAIVADNAI